MTTTPPIREVPGFTPILPVPVPRRVVASVEGMEKTGKTHFALTAVKYAPPVYFISIDIGTEGVVTPDFSGMPIRQLEIKVSEGDQVAQYKTQWDRFKAGYFAAVRNNQGTVIVDTGTEMYGLIRLAAFGRLSQIMPHLYGPINADLASIVRVAYENTGVNVIFLHKMGAQWVDNKRTGLWERKGWPDIGYQVQVNLRTVRVDQPGVPPQFGITVLDCRQNKNVIGQTWMEPVANVGFLLTMVHGQVQL